jgi:hypothetical protein
MRLKTALTAIAALAALAACGGNSVGSSGMFDYTPKPPGNFGFEHSPSPQAAAALGQQSGPTAAPKQTAPSPVAATFNIAIYSDTYATPGFYPAAANVYKGTIIVFTNKDSKPRSVVSDPGDPGSFSSPMIPPGGTWKYTANTLGQFNYHDGTRPYTIAYFKVINR